MSEGLLFLVKTLESVQGMRVAAQVRMAHLEKNENKCELTESIHTREVQFEEMLNKELEDRMKNHPAFAWFEGVLGIGLINIGKVVGCIDIHKATNISKLWRFAGFAVTSDGEAERRKKGEKLHYNSLLKSYCWRLGKSLVRAKGKYYHYYLAEKKKLMQREEDAGRKIVPSNKLPKEKGKHIENDEFAALGHVDMMALRKMIKLFLSHLWLEWRKAKGLEITEPYVHAIKKHSHLIDPYDMID